MLKHELPYIVKYLYAEYDLTDEEVEHISKIAHKQNVKFQNPDYMHYTDEKNSLFTVWSD